MVSFIVLVSSLFSANGNIQHFYDEVLCEMSMDTYAHGVDPTPLVKTLSNDSTLRITDINNKHFFGTLRGKSLTWDSHGRCLPSTCNPSDDLEYSEMWLIKP
jgi:hypothetical protein